MQATIRGQVHSLEKMSQEATARKRRTHMGRREQAEVGRETGNAGGRRESGTEHRQEIAAVKKRKQVRGTYR